MLQGDASDCRCRLPPPSGAMRRHAAAPRSLRWRATILLRPSLYDAEARRTRRLMILSAIG